MESDPREEGVAHEEVDAGFQTKCSMMPPDHLHAVYSCCVVLEVIA